MRGPGFVKGVRQQEPAPFLSRAEKIELVRQMQAQGQTALPDFERQMQAQGQTAATDSAPAAYGHTRAAVLDAAREAVLVDRAATHGALENSFGQLAEIWSTRLGVLVTADMVALMMVDLKVTRAWGNPSHLDNWVDIAGYAACGAEVAGVTTARGALDDPF